MVKPLSVRRLEPIFPRSCSTRSPARARRSSLPSRPAGGHTSWSSIRCTATSSSNAGAGSPGGTRNGSPRPRRQWCDDHRNSPKSTKAWRVLRRPAARTRGQALRRRFHTPAASGRGLVSLGRLPRLAQALHIRPPVLGAHRAQAILAAGLLRELADRCVVGLDVEAGGTSAAAELRGGLRGHSGSPSVSAPSISSSQPSRDCPPPSS